MDIEELKKELEAEREAAKAARSKAERLEEESKKYKSRAQDAESKISEAEKAKLEEQGKLEELLAKEREEKLKINSALESTRKKVLSQTLRSEVMKHAKDAHDVDALLSASAHKDLLSINDEDLSVSGVEDFVNKTRESQTFLFRQKNLDGLDDEGKPKPPKSKDEEYHAALDAATSRKELDAVKAKYGKI